MERFNGQTKKGLRSHTHPWANLDNRVRLRAQLEAVYLYYNLGDDIAASSGLNHNEGGLQIEKCKSDECMTYTSLKVHE